MWQRGQKLPIFLSLAAAGVLAGWWLFAVTVYFPPQPVIAVVLGAGAILLLTFGELSLTPRASVTDADQEARTGNLAAPPSGLMLAGTLFTISTIILPWPYRVIPLLLAVGSFVVWFWGHKARWLWAAGRACLVAGVLLSVQAAWLFVYFFQTMRWRDLPESWVRAVVVALRVVGIDAGRTGSAIALIGSDRSIVVPATWELVLDPATVLAWLGGLVVLGWRLLSHPEGPTAEGNQTADRTVSIGWSRFRTAALLWTTAAVVFVPFRVALLLGWHLHRMALTPAQIPLAAGDVFVSPTVAMIFALTLVIIGLAAVVWLPQWVRDTQVELSSSTEGTKGPQADKEGSSPEHLAVFASALEEPWRWQWHTQGGAVAAAILGAAACVIAVLWDPPGRPTAGRVVMVERHSTWEPSDRPYDMEHFGHDPSYSYTLVYHYCEQYFVMSRLGQEEEITRSRLKDCDVLIVKIPTERWQRSEIAAVVDFVREGGGLLLVGDHTNVFNSSTYLNDICRQFGFAYAADLLFWMPDAYRQPWRPGFAAHPAVTRVSPMYFAVGCSIDPGRAIGRAVIWSSGLWSLPCDFHTPNYHPVPQWRSDMRYGAFIQCWAMRYGRGRVMAFTDSTIFSNFCIFQPGKAELFREMIWWLARRGVYDRPFARWLLPMAGVALGAVLLAGAAVGTAVFRLSYVVLFGAIILGISLGLFVVDRLHEVGNPPPVCREPKPWVVIDRTSSQVPLALGAFNEDPTGNGFGLLEQWVNRLGYFTARRQGGAALGEAGLLVICPTKSPPAEFLDGLVKYVHNGGRLLVLDSPASEGTTANSLLWMFGLEMLHVTARGGKIRFADAGPQLDVDAACEVRGGEPLAWIDDLPVAARARVGQGVVVAIGFATLWNDRNMGEHWMIAPEPTLFRRADLPPELRDRFDALFAVLRFWLEDVPLHRPAPPTEVKPQSSSPPN